MLDWCMFFTPCLLWDSLSIEVVEVHLHKFLQKATSMLPDRDDTMCRCNAYWLNSLFGQKRSRQISAIFLVFSTWLHITAMIFVYIITSVIPLLEVKLKDQQHKHKQRKPTHFMPHITLTPSSDHSRHLQLYFKADYRHSIVPGRYIFKTSTHKICT